MVSARPDLRAEPVRLGLGANWRQFTLLAVVNAFVGAMVGLERSVLPLVAASDFGVVSATAALSFIAVFGVTKALTNLASGTLLDVRGRRYVLIAGWLAAVPVPLLVLAAESWWWIVAANALLGVNQGLAWSATIVMKIDLVGPHRRGLAMGLNEFAGYLAVAGAAFASGMVAGTADLRTGPAALGIGIALVGLALSAWFVRDTGAHVALEDSASKLTEKGPAVVSVLRRSLWSDRRMFSVSQAGLVNNLNDGLAWGLFPMLFAGAGFTVDAIGALAAIYPATWGVSQLATGPLSDRAGRKPLIVAGMILQGLALFQIAIAGGSTAWIFALAALGFGTALVYPTLLAAVADGARPAQRGAAVGVYRFWRDIGYVVGAVLAGILADLFGVTTAITTVALLTMASGVVVAVRFEETHAGGERP